MIISHKHKFIFIKTEKTAGTSIEIALSGICGPNDIITPISPVDEKYRAELTYRTKQNYSIPFSKYSKSDLLNFIFKRKRLTFYNHMAAAQIKKYTNNKQWNEYFKFAFERNPYDKLISWYYYCGGDDKFSSIQNFINRGWAAKIKGFDLYTYNSAIIINRVYKFEKLNKAMIDISKKLKLKELLKLPDKKAKSNFRKNKNHYKDILSEAEKVWVSKVFARELAFFNYEY